MPDIYLDVDVALAEVPVNIMPLLDDTDFKTRETAVAYNAAGMDLVWNFVTSAGAFTQTAVTPTTAGTYDWTHQGDGMYTIEIPASGGASINNDTEGYGWFTGFVTGVLPWRGPVIGFRSAALNDSLCDTNTTGLLAPTVAGRTLDVTATGAAGIDWGNVENPTTALNLSGTNIDPDQVVASVSGAVNSVTTGVTLATNAVSAAALAADAVTEIQSGLATAAALATAQTDLDNIDAKTTNLPTDPADQSLIIAATNALAALIGTPAGVSLSADVAAVKSDTAATLIDTAEIGAAGAGLTALASQASVNDLPTNAELATALAAADDAVLAAIAALSTVVGTPAGASVSADVAAVKSDTAATLIDTAEIGAAGAGLTALASQASVNDLPTNAELATALATADDAVLAAIAALNNLSAAQVNSEVVDALNVDAYSEPGQTAPPVSASLVTKVNYLYKLMRNRITQTSTQFTVYADDGLTVDQKAVVSDDGTTFDRAEIGAGP